MFPAMATVCFSYFLRGKRLSPEISLRGQPGRADAASMHCVFLRDFRAAFRFPAAFGTVRGAAGDHRTRPIFRFPVRGVRGAATGGGLMCLGAAGGNVGAKRRRCPAWERGHLVRIVQFDMPASFACGLEICAPRRCRARIVCWEPALQGKELLLCAWGVVRTPCLKVVPVLSRSSASRAGSPRSEECPADPLPQRIGRRGPFPNNLPLKHHGGCQEADYHKVSER